MAAISPPPLSLRDFIQHIFPTVIAICLFIPFYAPINKIISTEGLIVAAAILGYIISSPVLKLVGFAVRYIPLIGKKLREYKTEGEWHDKNWDYDRLFYLLSNDDREYIYLTGSYAEFYRLAGFYLLIYALVNVIHLLKALSYCPPSLLIPKALTVTTPMLGNWQANTLLLIAVSLTLSYYAFKDFLLEYGILFLSKGQYVSMAEKYHREKGGVAVSLWGKVHHRGKPVDAAQVELLGSKNTSLGKVKTTLEGNFQFPGLYTQCLGIRCKLRITAGAKSHEIAITPVDKVAPYFEIEFPHAIGK